MCHVNVLLGRDTLLGLILLLLLSRLCRFWKILKVSNETSLRFAYGEK
ncbi:hypothetical protein MHB84_06825 [Paenibacillus sp. FSL F4-0087]